MLIIYFRQTVALFVHTGTETKYWMATSLHLLVNDWSLTRMEFFFRSSCRHTYFFVQINFLPAAILLFFAENVAKYLLNLIEYKKKKSYICLRQMSIAFECGSANNGSLLLMRFFVFNRWGGECFHVG